MYLTVFEYLFKVFIIKCAVLFVAEIQCGWSVFSFIWMWGGHSGVIFQGHTERRGGTRIWAKAPWLQTKLLMKHYTTQRAYRNTTVFAYWITTVLKNNILVTFYSSENRLKHLFLKVSLVIKIMWWDRSVRQMWEHNRILTGLSDSNGQLSPFKDFTCFKLVFIKWLELNVDIDSDIWLKWRGTYYLASRGDSHLLSTCYIEGNEKGKIKMNTSENKMQT